MNRSSIEYAMQCTRVLYVPDRRIDTFGETRFNFRLITEPMDEVGVCRVRSGWVEANRPRILRPADLRGVEIEGFGADAARFFEWMEAHGAGLKALFQYGFCFSRSEVQEELVHDTVREVEDRVVNEALSCGDPYRAVISGVDDAWEVSLLGFMLEMIQKSHEINVFDFRRRGLI
ncbi:MAG: hypothetical protein E7032_04395 [Akkermansiaceae bacterium]|nr:hypothetical protein [Akkermansiaceae bacterium]